MIQRVNWDKVNYFSPKEKWGDVNKVNPQLIYFVDEFRHFVGKPFILHNAWADGGHSKTSEHYKGNALDGHFEGLSWLDQFLLAMKFGKFTGVGVYPDWNHPGLHLDVRELNNDDVKHTWLRYKGDYMAVDHHNIMIIENELVAKPQKIKKSKSEKTKE